jgi:hypothetical protein
MNSRNVSQDVLQGGLSQQHSQAHQAVLATRLGAVEAGCASAPPTHELHGHQAGLAPQGWQALDYPAAVRVTGITAVSVTDVNHRIHLIILIVKGVRHHRLRLDERILDCSRQMPAAFA